MWLIEKDLKHLPAKWKGVVQSATEKSLRKALGFAVKTMDDKTRSASSDRTHKILVFATGAGGGSLGLERTYGKDLVKQEYDKLDT